MSKLSTRDKRALAATLIRAAGNLMETDWQCGYYEGIKYLDTSDEDRQAVAQQLADWLGRLPGDTWDTRLPTPRYLNAAEPDYPDFTWADLCNQPDRA